MTLESPTNLLCTTRKVAMLSLLVLFFTSYSSFAQSDYDCINLGMIKGAPLIEDHLIGTHDTDPTDFAVGDVILYQTSEGRFGKMLITNIDENANQQLTVDFTTYAEDGAVHVMETDFNIPGTWQIDLDSAVLVGALDPDIEDFFWQRSGGTSTLSVRNGSLVAVYNGFVHIPDANFKAYLVSDDAIDTDFDDEISCAEAAAFTGTIDCHSLNISDLTGIEAFTAATKIYFYDNQVSEVDLSENVAVEDLWCWDNNIATLDLSSNTALTRIQCYNNGMTSLDVTACSMLDHLNCQLNNLASLDISNNAVIRILLCWSNELTSLDVTNNPLMQNFQCYNNNLTTLDVSNCPQIFELQCHLNELTSLDVSALAVLGKFHCNNNLLETLDLRNGNNQALEETKFFADNNPNLSCIFVDSLEFAEANWTNVDHGVSFVEDSICPCFVDIPDSAFKAVLIADDAIDTDFDDEISCVEAAAYAGIISVPSLGINDLTGIEAFTAITELRCQSNNLTSLDVSANTELRLLYCHENQLSTLDVSANTSLEDLWCYSAGLASLDISDLTSLATLRCHSNELPSLDVTANSALTELWCSSNFFTSLDVSANPLLVDLRCQFNSIETLDLSNHAALEQLRCQSNQLTSLNITGDTLLYWLDIANNELTSLDLSTNKALTRIWANSNEFTTLDMSNLVDLDYFACSSCMLTSLDLSNNPLLTILGVGGNDLTKIDVSAQVLLQEFYAFNNELDSINLVPNIALTRVEVDRNILTYLNLANGTNTNIVSIDISENAPLTCVDVDDATYSTTNWLEKDPGTMYSEDCSLMTSIDEKWHGIESFFPNPANDLITIHLREISNYALYNAQGQEMAQGIFITGENILRIEDLIPGVYTLVFESNSQLRFLKE